MAQQIAAKTDDGSVLERQRKHDTGTLGKAMDVLKIVANAQQPIRFTGILGQTDQPRGTLHRQIANLVEEGLLTSNSDHTYQLGLSLLELAAKAWGSNGFRQIAEPHICRLQQLTGETVHLGILKDNRIIYLDKVEAQHSVRMYSQIGNASPLHCTGVGKAALSTLENSEILKIVGSSPLEKFTANTITKISGLMKEIECIRKTGNAWDREEHETGIHCVAAPVKSSDGTIAAGISVTGPVFRISAKDLENWSGLVRNTAHDIMSDMAIKLSPRL